MSLLKVCVIEEQCKTTPFLGSLFSAECHTLNSSMSKTCNQRQNSCWCCWARVWAVLTMFQRATGMFPLLNHLIEIASCAGKWTNGEFCPEAAWKSVSLYSEEPQTAYKAGCQLLILEKYELRVIKACLWLCITFLCQLQPNWQQKARLKCAV